MKQVQRKATCLIWLQESRGQASKLHNMFPDQSGLAAQRTASVCDYLCGRRQPRCLLTGQRREWQLCGAKAVRHRHGDVCEETTQLFAAIMLLVLLGNVPLIVVWLRITGPGNIRVMHFRESEWQIEGGLIVILTDMLYARPCVVANAWTWMLCHGGNQEQKKKLAERLQPEVASLSKDNYGCRVVQKAKFLPSFCPWNTKGPCKIICRTGSGNWCCLQRLASHAGVIVAEQCYRMYHQHASWLDRAELALENLATFFCLRFVSESLRWYKSSGTGTMLFRSVLNRCLLTQWASLSARSAPYSTSSHFSSSSANPIARI